MKKFSSISILLVILSGLIKAQETRFFMPLEIQKAYENGTRAMNGAPGDAYWQNTVDYQIEVTVDPSDRSLTGSETVTYHNNSPNPLSSFVVRVYYDVFRKGNQRLMSVNTEDVTDGIEISNLKINGEEYVLGTPEVGRTGTNLNIRLRQSLEPGGSLTFSCSWKQYVPLTVRRTGAIDSTSFFVAYWYPQVAVYDDVFGWDRMNYTFRTEFYNNLGNYDVQITAPEEFTIWATGELQNASGIFTAEILERYNTAKASEDVVHVITPADLDGGYKNAGTTWHYTASEVSDFAFATSDHYCWDAGIQKVEGRKVLVSSVFPVAKAEDYVELTQIQQKTMKHFSEDIPGVPYPYPAFTTFIGLRGGGMEFPMMANNGNQGRGVTIHEMFHTYFPMYVRINERRFAWMDEGWADFVTAQVDRRFFEESDLPVFAGLKVQIQNTIGKISDLPMITSSQFMDNTNYSYASYPLPSFIYAMLNHHLGDEVFLNCLRTYIDRWKKKSPTPYDFFYTFENVSGQDLSWLWKPWFFSFGYPDIQIVSFEGKTLTLKNAGTKPVPLKIDITYNDDREVSITESAKIWTENDGFYSTELENADSIKKIIVNKVVPDVTELDNFYPPISEIYASMEIPSDIPGEYQIIGFPVTASISEKEGAFYLVLQGTGIESYLYPETTLKFESLNGAIKIEFVMEGELCTGMNIAAFGYNLTSKKK